MRLHLTAALCLSTPVLAQETQPNILLIIADDMGRDALSCYDVGNQQAPMPVVEELCAQGMVFDNAYAYPVCSPTRASLLTGRYASETGVGDVVSFRNQNSGLSESYTSLFDVLAPTDYATTLIGKWHLASQDDGYNHPASFGVSDYFGLYTGGTRDYFRWNAVENGARTAVDGYMTSVFTDRAADWIAAQDDNPWFLWLAYTAPHSPFHTPPQDLHGFGDIDDEDENTQYNAMLEAMDTEIGRLLDGMDPDTRANTVVIFIGDNGSPSQLVRGLYAPHAAKGTLYESGIHVPMVMAGPGVASGRTDAFASVTDLHETIAALAGTQGASPASYNLLPVLSGGEGPRDVVFIERFGDAPANRRNSYGWSIRQGDMKLLMNDNDQAELYNLATDPMEQTDLLADGISDAETAIVAALTAERDARVE